MTISRRILTVFTGALLGIFFLVPIADAESVKELKNNISDINEQIAELEREIEQYREEANIIGQEKRTLETTIQKIDVERKKLSTDITLTDSKINETRYTLEELRDNIDYTENIIQLHRDTIGKSIRTMHELEEQSLLEMFIADESTLSDTFEQLHALRSLQTQLGGRVDTLRKFKVELGDQKNEFLTEEEQLQELKDKIAEQKKVADSQKQNKEILLRETRNEEAKYQELIAEREALRKAFEQELFAYESELQFILDPTILPKKGSGALSWPLDNIVITALFKSRIGPHSSRVNGHSGVDFRGNGDPVYAMADGVVMGVGDTDQACNNASFGKWVLIKYNNNLASTYGHLSIISVSKGQKVKRGQLVAFSGNTGFSTAPHLHVSVYAAVDASGKDVVKVEGKPSNACKGKTLVQPRAPLESYQDPLNFLPPADKSKYKAGVGLNS